MDPAELLAASRSERALYEELIAAYAAEAAALEVEGGVDPEAISAAVTSADAVVARLRALHDRLAVHRLGRAPVPATVRDVWRLSAALAEEASRANARLTALARSRFAEVTGRLARLRDGRRGLVGYRPADPVRPGLEA